MIMEELKLNFKEIFRDWCENDTHLIHIAVEMVVALRKNAKVWNTNENLNEYPEDGKIRRVMK